MDSSELKGYLTGLIFGDGYIDKGVTKRSFVIKNTDFAFITKIKEDLESCSNFKISIKFIPEHYSSGCHHKDAWELRTDAHPYFNKKYHHFYDDYRKRIASKESLSWITPCGIANWYMSDGYVCHVGKTKGKIYNRRVEFSTDRYSKDTVIKMQTMFKERFKIDTTLVKRYNTYRLRVSMNSYSDFINLIKPYIIPSMQYKLYLGYEHQPKWMDDDMWAFQENLHSAITLTDNAEG